MRWGGAPGCLWLSGPEPGTALTEITLSAKLEKKLKAQIEAWEKEAGREFLVNGQKFLQYVEEQWEVHRTEKEQEKLQRVKAVVVPQYRVAGPKPGNTLDGMPVT